MKNDFDAATVAAAKRALRTALEFRGCVSDTPAWAEVFEEFKDIAGLAKSTGIPVSGGDWVYLAGLVDEACDDDGLPRLFDVEGAAA